MGFALKKKSSKSVSHPLVVLVVEDELLVRLDIAEYLENAGCLVLEARSSAEAVAMCRDGKGVNVLLTDINLDGSGSGWDVAEALRAAQPDMGVVYVSGNSADHSRRVHGSLFFNKPYRSSDILQACLDLA
jgi:CheY-like chemotaxis protein